MSHSITVDGETYNITEKQLEKIKKELEPKKPKGVTIYKRNGSVLVETSFTTIKEAVIDNKENLREANLSELDLSGLDLSEADLSMSDLSGTNLYETDLSRSDLYGADLSGANLSVINLSGANIFGVELQNAKFYGKGGTTKIKKSQLNDFLKALGVIMED